MPRLKIRRAPRRALLFVLSLAGVAPLGAQQSTPPTAPPARDTVWRTDSLARRDSARADSLARRDSARVQHLAPVTVVAAPAERAQPVSATHVDAATIRATPAATPYELLRQTAGVEVHEQGQGPGFASDASLRGFSSDHSTDLALWIDGVPVNEPVNGHSEGYNDFSLLFPGGVQDIDVVRGPTSALFGNFSLAGTVNVRTLERMRGTELTAAGGSFGHADAMLLTGVDRGATGGVLGVRYAHDDGFRPNADYDLGQLHARAVRDLRPGLTLDAGAELYGTRWSSAGFLGEDQFTAGDYGIVSNPSDGGYKRRAQERVSLRAISGSSVWRTTAYATQGRWQLFLTIPPAGGRFEGSGSQTEEEDARYGAGLTSAFTHGFARGELTGGVEGRLDHARYQDFFTTARTRDSVAELVSATQLSAAPFVQSYMDVTSRLRVDAGLRYDVLDTRSTPDGEASASAAHGVLSPKLGAMLRVTPSLGIYGNAARGFRSSDGVIGDPALAPIVAWAYEGGVKLDGHGALHGAMANAALFRMDVSNEQTFDPITGDASNGGASRRQGLELGWRIPLAAPVSASGDWTFLDARYRHLTAVAEDGDEPPATLDGLRVYNTARYVGSAAIELAPRGAAWRLRASGNWVGPYSPFDEPGVVLGAYGLLHAGATVRLHGAAGGAHGAELDLGVRNLLDRAYPEVVAGHVVAPGQPRSLYATLHWRI